MSILNQMRKNPAMTAGAVIFIIALIAVIGWIVNRGKKGSTGSTGGVKPSITFGASSVILNPNTGNVETYKTEYAMENLGQNIDISISWKNGGGFEQSGVNSIIVKRKKEDSYINVSDNSDTNVITTQSFLEDFTDCETTILGEFIGTNDVVGVNTIEVYYTTTNNSTPVLLGSVEITIEQNHLNTTIDLDTVTSITIPPTSGSDIISVLNVPEFTTFDITSVERNRRVAPSVRFEKLADGSIKLKDDDGNIVVLPGTSSDSETYIFEKYLDEHYFIKPFGQDRYYIDDAGLHATSLILRSKAEIFASQDSLQKGLFIIKQTETRPYPPKPYPNATGGTTVTNTYSWTVTGSGYGEGEYRVEAANSLLTDPTYDGALDAEGLFNKGIDSTTAYDGAEPAYHSNAGGEISWFHFYLPVYIKLDRLNIYPRGHSADEITNMNSSWTIAGVDRSSGSPVETRLYTNDNVTFTDGEIKSLYVTPSRKFNEFKVAMDPIGASYMVFNELLFYGTEEDTGTDFKIKDNYHSDLYTGVIPAANPGDQYKELGAGTSVEACRTLATADGWKAYGFRKKEQTCWAMKDVGIVSNGLLYDTNYTIGCTDAGKTIDGNCGYDVRKGHHVVESDYDAVDESGASYPGMSMDDCRKLAESKNWKTFGHRTRDHPTLPNTCWGITGTWNSGNIVALDNHSIGCTETGKTLNNQCN